MGRPQARKKKPRVGNADAKYKKVKRYGKFIDQIWDETREEVAPATLAKNTQPDEDLPGMGQYYCITCARHFLNQKVLDDHLKTKMHKRRLKLLKEKPWSAEDALGMKIDNGPRRAKKEEPATPVSVATPMSTDS